MWLALLNNCLRVKKRSSAGVWKSKQVTCQYLTVKKTSPLKAKRGSNWKTCTDLYVPDTLKLLQEYIGIRYSEINALYAVCFCDFVWGSHQAL